MNCVVHPDKVTKYLLNLGHWSGAAKAAFFLAKGYSVTEPQLLADALMAHPLQAVLAAASEDAEGRRLVYECGLTVPDGSVSCIRSIWIEAADRSYTRLISAYPFP